MTEKMRVINLHFTMATNQSEYMTELMDSTSIENDDRWICKARRKKPVSKARSQTNKHTKRTTHDIDSSRDMF